MGITTKRGDKGNSDLYSEGVSLMLPKSDPVFEVLGNLDELSSFLGVAKVHARKDSRELIETFQKDLITIGGTVAGSRKKSIGEGEMAFLERRIVEMEKGVGKIDGFVLQGGSVASAHLDVARSVCRRLERSLSESCKKTPSGEYSLRYINRLSDLLFLMARLEEKHAINGH